MCKRSIGAHLGFAEIILLSAVKSENLYILIFCIGPTCVSKYDDDREEEKDEEEVYVMRRLMHVRGRPFSPPSEAILSM